MKRLIVVILVIGSILLSACKPAAPLQIQKTKDIDVPLSLQDAILVGDTTVQHLLLGSEELVPGQILLFKGRNDYRAYVLILSEAYWKDGECRMDLTNLDNNFNLFGKYKERGFCSDYGLIPYDDGRWNPTNQLLTTGRNVSSDIVSRLQEILECIICFYED
jgi:hypothetical protein